MKARTAAILLAAGESTRMGSPKALLDWSGKPLLCYQVEQLKSAGLDLAVVVLGHSAELVATALVESPGVMVVVNRGYHGGKSTSIRAGVEAVPGSYDSVLVLAVDQPRSAETIERLIAAHHSGHSLITLPVVRGRRGHPPVFDSSLIPELLQLSEETQGLRKILRDHEREIAEVSFDSPEVLLNLNTPEEYQQAQQIFRFR